MMIVKFVLMAIALSFVAVWACKSPDKVMEQPKPKPRPNPADPDAGVDRMFAWINSTANWMIVATVIVVALGFLLHNCKDFAPLITWR